MVQRGLSNGVKRLQIIAYEKGEGYILLSE
jgi:hypothetical protein